MELTQQQIQEQKQAQEIHQIQSQVIKIDEKLDNVLSILTGNELDKEEGGMIKKVKDHEIRISSLEKSRYTLLIILAVASILGGYSLWDIINKLIKLK